MVGKPGSRSGGNAVACQIASGVMTDAGMATHRMAHPTMSDEFRSGANAIN